MPFINIDVPLYARDVSTREIIYIIIINNINTDHIMRNLPDDNDKHYIEHFKILEDPQQKEKGRSLELILNTEKNKQIWN